MADKLEILKFIAIDGASVAFWMTLGTVLCLSLCLCLSLSDSLSLSVELLLLGLFAVKFACRIATEYKYRLYLLRSYDAFECRIRM